MLKKPSFIQKCLNYIALVQIQGGQKKKRTGDFFKNSQNIGPMNLKNKMHNLNTHSFQHFKYEFPNVEAF